MLRFSALAALALVATPAAAKDAVGLSPIGLPFGPDGPRRLPTDHVLTGAIVLDGADALPQKMGSAKRDQFATALSETLAQLGMLATDPAKARFRLTPVWVGLDSPFKISFKNRATVHMSWRLTRIDTGQTIFARQIDTSAESSGGDASARVRGIERIALMTNIASVAACLDKAAYGKAPTNCALTPGFTYRAPSPPMVIFVPRFR
ncbi:hypothetical protein FPZ24_09565 [Sphingomonas panacisoli]|uniref:Uncharacterized protein n=1 Tax=Sphingomonas panacisoli TaxID=1813879 RepID=A0A5B8LHD3_9SPHN|nr:hypothetical protein [Sphingomonas panacisoli]QDZ07707.1 hypothetical protein FPZ24_09565 [Sphingomonas panacisoli]